MRRYQQGDGEAARELIRQTAGVLYRSVQPFINNQAEAEDVLQDAWLKIHVARHTWRPGELALPWLLAIVRFTRIDYLRRQYRRRESGLEALASEPVARGGAPENSDEIQRMLRALPESQREVLIMLKVEGLTLEETARVTGSSIGAVKQKASRAYARLRGLLSRGVAGDESTAVEGSAK